MAILVPLAIVEMAFEGGLTLSYKLLIDNAIVPGDGRALAIILSALAACVVVTSLLALLRDYLFAGFLSRILSDVRKAAFDHCQKLSVGFHARTPSAELLSRFSTDLAGLEGWLSSAVTGFLLPGIGLIIGTSLLFFVIEWHVAVIGTLIWPLVLIGPRLIAPKAARVAYSKKRDEAKALATVEETIEAHKLIKAYGLMGFARSRFERDVVALSKSTSRAGFLSSLVERSTVTTIYSVQVAAVAVGAFMAYRGQLSVGSFVSFLTIFWNLGWLLVVVGRTAPSLVSAASSMRRIDELLDEETDPAQSNGTKALPLKGSIRFDDVVFGYEADKPILKNVSFEIRRGESVAFVGASGSGKSTVLNLLARYYDAQEGRILFDGMDVKALSADSIRSQMGLVSQESFLFDMTIRDNIGLGDLDASEERIEIAAKAAEIHEAILAMPDGYERKVGERGGLLSGGERQRVSIARALLRDPPILLLDEASSALDPATEAAVNETLARAGVGRTTISVTHRLASVTSADRIFVMERGRVVEQGSHLELIERNGVYAELWRKQEGFVVSEDGSKAQLTPAPTPAA